MYSACFQSPCAFTLKSGTRPCCNSRGLAASPGQLCWRAKSKSNPLRRRDSMQVQAYQVEIQHDNGTDTLEVEEGTTILEAALATGLKLSHDCKMGVCMTCPARLVSGEIDQSAGMLDDEVKDKGYALLCVAEPRTDCVIKTIEEDELLAEVLQGG